MSNSSALFSKKRPTRRTLLTLKLPIISLLLLLNFNSTAEVFVQHYASVNASDGLVFDVQGNLFAASYRHGFVYKITPDRESTLIIDTQDSGPAGMVFDDSGILHIVLHKRNRVIKIEANGTISDLVTNLSEPIGIDFDSLGNLYVANWNGNPTITKVLPDGTSTAFYQNTQLQQASTVAIDNEDNIYLGNYVDGKIIKIAPDGSSTLFADTNVNGFGFIIFDGTKFFLTGNSPGNIYTLDMQGNIADYAGSGTVGNLNGPAFEAQFDRPNGLAVNSDGSVYVAEGNQPSIRRIFTVADGAEAPPYFNNLAPTRADEGEQFSHTYAAIDPNDDTLVYELSQLPSWLSFDGVDTISGTPTSANAGISYSFVASVSDGKHSYSIEQTADILVIKAPAPPPPPPPPVSSGGGGSMGLLILLCLGFRTARQLFI